MTVTPQAVLFDLDGTLVDTAPDLVAALNRVRADDNLEPLGFNEARKHVSHGSYALVRCAYDYPDESTEFQARRDLLLAYYHENVARASRLFDGMESILQKIESSGRPWGIVTNKPGWLTTPLLRALDLDTRAACVVSGDSTEHAKPHPQPLLHATNEISVTSDKCLYIGDAERDVQAARAAAMPVVIALYGYLATDDQPQAWGADGCIDSPGALAGWL